MKDKGFGELGIFIREQLRLWTINFNLEQKSGKKKLNGMVHRKQSNFKLLEFEEQMKWCK